MTKKSKCGGSKRNSRSSRKHNRKLNRTVRKHRKRNNKRGGWGVSNSEAYSLYIPNFFTDQTNTYKNILGYADTRVERMSNDNYPNTYATWSDETIDTKLQDAQMLKEKLATEYEAKVKAREADIARIRMDDPKWSANQMFNKLTGNEQGRVQKLKSKIDILINNSRLDKANYDEAQRLMDRVIAELREAKIYKR